MIIRAIRVAETGPFLEPVCIEGLSGRLDVLVASNEAGKSTLLTALATLVGEKHTSTGRAIAALKPDAGGAPLIEADLEFAGRLVRVRKRFISQRSAEVCDLARGQVWRGADAENELERLIGGEGAQALRGLMWVRQGDSFALPADRDAAALSSGLAQLIEAEAADSAGGGAARRLAQRVKEQLGGLVTAAHGKAKANSDLDKALRQRDQLLAALEQARARAAAADARRHRLDALRLELQSLIGQAGLAALKEQAQSAANAVGAAEAARDKQKTARERVEARQLAVDAARQACERLETAEREAAQVSARVSTGRGEARELDARQRALSQDVAARQADSARAQQIVAGCRRDVHAAQLARVHLLETEVLAAARRRLDDARGAERSLAGARARLAANTLTPDVLQAIQDGFQRIATFDARIAAQAAVATINYLPGAAERFSLDGRPVADGARIGVERRIVIEVEGIGSIEIASAMADRPENAVDQREAEQAKLAALLARHGVGDLAEAQAKARARQHDEAAVRSEQQRLSSLARDGCDRLSLDLSAQQAKVDALVAEIAALASAGGPSNADAAGAQAALAAAERIEAEAGQRAEAARSALAEVVSRQRVLAERVAADAQRLAQLDADLGEADTREARRRATSEVLAAAEATLGEAVRELSAWSEAVPDAAGFAQLLTARAAADREVARMTSRRGALEQEIAEVSGALNRDGEDGSGSDVPRLEEALGVAQARVADLELDVAALRLLADRLDQSSREQRGRVLQPVIERLEPMLQRLFPGMKVVMDGPLLLTRLDRGERGDSMTRLSGGTREQVATMVRLAYAGLLAHQGKAMPVVLDDALVFSDDERLALMFELLAASAKSHQVLLLSCHHRTVEPLIARHGAMALRIEAWEPQADVEGVRAGGARGRRK